MNRLFFGIALFLALCGSAYPQSTFATITGTVTDGTGAVIPNASVTVTNIETNIAHTAKSNEVGIYMVPQLKEGQYELKVAASGFDAFVAQKIQLVARDVRRVDAVLKVGTTGTTIEVKGGATLIETESARISDTKSAETLRTIPMNARWLVGLRGARPGRGERQ